MRSSGILEFLLIVSLAVALIVKPAPPQATAKSPVYSSPAPTPHNSATTQAAASE
jgi:hypothetical protein